VTIGFRESARDRRQLYGLLASDRRGGNGAVRYPRVSEAEHHSGGRIQLHDPRVGNGDPVHEALPGDDVELAAAVVFDRDSGVSDRRTGCRWAVRYAAAAVWAWFAPSAMFVVSGTGNTSSEVTLPVWASTQASTPLGPPSMTWID